MKDRGSALTNGRLDIYIEALVNRLHIEKEIGTNLYAIQWLDLRLSPYFETLL